MCCHQHWSWIEATAGDKSSSKGVAWSVCVCLSVGYVHGPCKTAEPIEMPFGGLNRVGSSNNESDVVRSRSDESIRIRQGWQSAMRPFVKIRWALVYSCHVFNGFDGIFIFISTFFLDAKFNGRRWLTRICSIRSHYIYRAQIYKRGSLFDANLGRALGPSLLHATLHVTHWKLLGSHSLYRIVILLRNSYSCTRKSKRKPNIRQTDTHLILNSWDIIYKSNESRGTKMKIISEH